MKLAVPAALLATWVGGPTVLCSFLFSISLSVRLCLLLPSVSIYRSLCIVKYMNLDFANLFLPGSSQGAAGTRRK
ncbi:hypothetical protein PAHAL_9G450600 [Panicum hallii]|uniref:Uncharacterized protein n=1 Tax=Panicum hallii TaxID=206008 RepID=A0A2T8I4P9_9POAL|nr:hypothetical protein PAHAL_9G450600 [Panicum hallii]